jgi:hypothetical protein
MHKLKYRNTRNMKKQGNVNPPKGQNASITESKETEIA